MRPSEVAAAPGGAGTRHAGADEVSGVAGRLRAAHPRRRYEIHGVPVDVCGDSPGTLARAGQVFRRLGLAAATSAGGDAIVVRLREGAPLRLPIGAKPAGEHQGIRAWTTPGGMRLRCRGHVAELNPRAGTAGIVLPPEPQPVRKDLLTYTLLLLLRRRSLFGLHASAVARDGDGWLFVGARGSGKSTQTYNLVRRGWEYLGDDALLLRAEGDRVEALSLRRDLMLDPTPADAYPELTRLRSPSARGKRRLPIAEMYPARLVDRSSPRFLIFPEIVPTAKSELVALSPTEALMRLVAQSAVFTLDRAMAARHLEVLSHLTRQTLAWRLRAGQDLRECPERVAALLEGV